LEPVFIAAKAFADYLNAKCFSGGIISMRYALSFVSMVMIIFAVGNAAPATAGEVFGGVLSHEVNTPFTLKTFESGVDFQIGYRADKIVNFPLIGGPSPYAFVSLNSAGDTSFAAAGLSWKLGKTLYVRPGIGLAVHTGKIPINGAGTKRIDLGSRILFEPEIGIGYQLNDRLSVEASWTHISNAQLLSGQNPGLDMIGLRAHIRL
jgi:lipid A 3-O-deacylase